MTNQFDDDSEPGQDGDAKLHGIFKGRRRPRSTVYGKSEVRFLAYYHHSPNGHFLAV